MIFEKIISERLYANCELKPVVPELAEKAGSTQWAIQETIAEVENVNVVVLGDACWSYICRHHPERLWMFYDDFQLMTGNFNIFLDFSTKEKTNPFGVHVCMTKKPSGLSFGAKAAYSASCMIYFKDELVSMSGVLLNDAGRIVSMDDDLLHPISVHPVLRNGSSLTVDEAAQRAVDSAPLLIPAFFALTFLNCRPPGIWESPIPRKLKRWQKQHPPAPPSMQSSFVSLNVIDNEHPLDPIPVGWFEFGEKPVWVAGRAVPRHEARVALMEDAHNRRN